MPRDYAHEACWFRTALMLGLTSGEVVIAWADGVIHDDPAPPLVVLEAALVEPSNLSALRQALQPLAGDQSTEAVLRELLAVVQRDLMEGRRDLHGTIRVLSLMRRALTLPDDWHWAIDTLEDDHMLASAGVTGNEAGSRADVERWLGQFDAPLPAFVPAPNPPDTR